MAKLKCQACDTVIENNFRLSKFDYLSDEELFFTETFIRCRGNIKEVEKELGISYPTVRSKLDGVIKKLGYEENGEEQASRKEEILRALENGEDVYKRQVLNICTEGDHIVSSAPIYGGTSNLFTVTMKKMGIEVTLVDPDAPADEIAKAFQPNTKALFAETISNPSLVVLDIEKFADLAHSHGVPLIIDNTFATPINLSLIHI